MYSGVDDRIVTASLVALRPSTARSARKLAARAGAISCISRIGKPSVTRPLSKVRDQIVAMMRLHKAQEVERWYVEDLLTRSPLSINQADLQNVQAGIK